MQRKNKYTSKKTRMKKSIGLMILLTTLVVIIVGCGSKDEAVLSHLQEKYDVEFERVGEAEDRGTSSFSFPWDSHDKWVYYREKGKEYSVFLTTLSEKGEYLSDEYPKRRLEAQLEEQMGELASRMADNYHVHVEIDNMPNTGDWKKDSDLNYYLSHYQKVEANTADITVYVDASTLKGIGEQEEYTLFSDYVGKNLPDAFLTIFFLNTKEMKTCKSYWKISTTVSGEVGQFYDTAPYFATVEQDGGLKDSEIAYSRIRRTIGS